MNCWGWKFQPCSSCARLLNAFCGKPIEVVIRKRPASGSNNAVVGQVRSVPSGASSLAYEVAPTLVSALAIERINHPVEELVDADRVEHRSPAGSVERDWEAVVSEDDGEQVPPGTTQKNVPAPPASRRTRVSAASPRLRSGASRAPSHSPCG